MLTRIAFFTSNIISLPVLNFLNLNKDIKIVGLITTQDRRLGRGKKLRNNVFKQWSIKNSIPVLQIQKKLNKDINDWLIKLDVKLIFVMAFGYIVPNFLIQNIKLGIFNLHASLLPKYRGSSPIEGAIASGDIETGVTLIKINNKIDAGRIVDQEKINIDLIDDKISISKKIAQSSVIILKRNIKNISLNQLILKKQNEKKASFTRKLIKNDGWINFNLSAEMIVNCIRAFSSWPGTFFKFKDKKIKIGSASVIKSLEKNTPGTILVSKSKKLYIATGENILSINTIQRPGGKMLPISDFLNGYLINQGNILNSGFMMPLVSKKNNNF